MRRSAIHGEVNLLELILNSRKPSGINQQVIIRHNSLPCKDYIMQSNINQGSGLGYHQFRKKCISPTQSVVCHHCERDTT